MKALTDRDNDKDEHRTTTCLKAKRIFTVARGGQENHPAAKRAALETKAEQVSQHYKVLYTKLAAAHKVLQLKL